MKKRKRTYAIRKCQYCGKMISAAGNGAAHYRKHVKEGILREIKRDWRTKNPKVRFERIET